MVHGRPHVTVTLGSSRPGGIDISLAGLAAQTYQDFEVIFVDHRYHKRHAQVMAAVARSGLKQPFYHVPNHRYRADAMGSSSAGFNTGFMLANGEIIIMLMDYSFTPPNWIASHVNHGNSKLTIGPFFTRDIAGHVVSEDGGPWHDFTDRRNIDGLPFDTALANILGNRGRFDEISIFGSPFSIDQLDSFAPLPEGLQEERYTQIAASFVSNTLFFTKNESFPREAILDVNGMDENCDRHCLAGDYELGMRLSRHLAMRPWFEPKAVIHSFNPRAILPKPINAMTTHDLPPPPYDKILPIHHPASYGWLKLREKDPSLSRAGNPFDIRERKSEIWHWRELCMEKEPLIPKNVIADSDYYKEDLR